MNSEYRMLIDGKLREASTKETMDVINPAICYLHVVHQGDNIVVGVRDYRGKGVFKEKWVTMGSKSRSSWSKRKPSIIQKVAIIISTVFRTVTPAFRRMR